MTVWEEIEEYVRQRGRAISVQVELLNGSLSYYISATSSESLPLSGWKWEDPELYTSAHGATLDATWSAWKDEVARFTI